jgi:hypothetical protein
MQPLTKASAAAPKLDSNMEMGSIQNESAGAATTAAAPPAHEDDIMQFARTGDVPAMEKLFESGESDATYTDDEGITPLHVRARALYRLS